VIVGGVLALFGIVWLAVGNYAALPMVGGAVVFSLWGLISVAFGELVGVLFAIEENTRGGWRPAVPDRTATGRPSGQSGAPESGPGSGAAADGESEGDELGEVDYIVVAGEKYRALEGASGKAFCLGCRSVSAKKDLYYNKAKDAYYHRQCVPGD
jgi:hypothetical protein